MQITEVRIFPANEEKLRGYATITVDGCLAIHDVKIIQGHTGLFISMPSKKLKDGKYKDIVHPTNSETREMIQSAVIAEYKKLTAAQTQPAKA